MATATTPNAPPTTFEPDGLYEVVDGQVVETPPMGAYEVELASILQNWMGPFAMTNRLGRVVTEMLFVIDPSRGRERRPDVAFVSHGRWPIDRRAPKAAAWDVVPDLAVEIISPTNRGYDDAIKLEEYFRAGTRLVWVVYPPTSKVYAYDSPSSVRILALGDDLDGGAVLPGFRLPLATLFGAEGDST
jgi:Uma2 family endonuclease